MFKDSRWLQRCLVILAWLWIYPGAVVSGDVNAGREAQADAAVKDRLWQLSRFDALEGDKSFSIGASDRYTLILLMDGSYRVRADCNRMQGAYRLEGERRIAIAPGATTLSECGPDSHYSQYLQQLTKASRFEVIEKTGQLKLISAQGQLMFDHAGHEPP